MEKVTKRAELKAVCEDFASNFGAKRDNREFGLEMLGLYLLSHHERFVDSFYDDPDEPSLINLAEFYAGGAYDGGIDGLIFSDDLQTVGIVQSTFRSGRVTQDTRDKARGFYSRLPEWTNPELRSKLNEKSLALLEESGLDPSQQEVYLVFLTSESASPEQQHEVEQLAQESQDSYRARGWNVSCSFLTQSEILRDLTQVKRAKAESLVSTCSFNIAQRNSFEYALEGDNRVLVCAIKGNEIRDLYRQPGLGDALFNTNIRSGLKTGKVNPTIVMTAEDPVESKNFFYYNNGITATCSSYVKSGSEVRVENLQIVNGAQTVKALTEALKTPNPRVHVLFRIIETGQSYGKKSELADKITRFQNTQNAVKASDFFANDPIQVWLSRELRKKSGSGAAPVFWYENKRGMKKPPGKTGKKISIVELAQLRYACLWGAPFTYRHAIEIWSPEDDNEHYWKAFGHAGDVAESWVDEEVSEALWMIRTWLSLRTAHRNIRAGHEEAFGSEALYLGVLARYITALSFTVLRKERDDGRFSFVDLMASEKAVVDTDSRIIQYARDVVSDEFDLWVESKNVANPRLNMPQSQDTWSKLVSKLPSKLKKLG